LIGTNSDPSCVFEAGEDRSGWGSEPRQFSHNS
jgi:hypothetical protein